MALINFIEPYDEREFGSGSTGIVGSAGVVSSNIFGRSFAFRCNPTTTGTGFGRIYKHDATGQAVNFSASTVYSLFDFAYATKPSSGDEEIWNHWDPNQRLTIRLNSSGNLVAYNGTTLLSTGSQVLAADTPYTITCKAVINTGTWEINLYNASGSLLEAMSGSATFGAVNIITVHVGKVTNRNGNTVDFYFGRMILSDSAYPTVNQKIACAVADGNGTYTAWTGDYTPEWTEAPLITTDDAAASQYVSTSNDLDAESATMQSCAQIGVSGTINAVKALAVVRQASTAVNLIARLRSSTTNVDTTGFTVGTTYIGSGILRETDPATSAAWTSGGVDGIEVGVVHNQSQTREARCTAVFALVLYTPAAGSLTEQDIDAIAVGVAGLSRVITFKRTLDVDAVGVPSVSRQLSFNRTLSSTAVGVPTVSRQSSFFRTLEATAVGVASVKRKMFATISATAVGAVALATNLSFSKLLEAVAVGSPTLSIIKMYYRSLVATAVGVTSIRKLVSKTLSATSTGVVSIHKLIDKTLVAISSGVANVSTTAAVTVTLEAIAVGVTSIQKLISKSLVATSVGVSSIRKLTTKTLSATASGVVTIQRLTHKLLHTLSIGLPSMANRSVLTQAIDAVAMGVATIMSTLIIGAVGGLIRIFRFFRNRKIFTRSN